MAASYLIIQTAFIGDVILATSVAERLHRVFPEARIDMLVRKGNEGVLEGHPFLHRVITWDKRRRYPEMWRAIRELRDTHYDTVINLQRFASSGIFTLAARSDRRIGFDKNPLSFLFTERFPHRIGVASQERAHEIDRCLALVDSFTDQRRDLPRIYPREQDILQVETYRGHRYVTCSPASVWFTKQWPESRWAELIRAFPPDLRVFLLGSPADRSLCERIARASGRDNAKVLAGSLGLLASAALMQHAQMNYTNDSAPLHLCSATDAPVTAIFCSTVPAFGFGPLSRRSCIAESGHALDCRPCGLHGHRACPEGHFRCADIDPKVLLATLDSES
jgi:ADP-heptose:LPS heptosyltransferase